MHYKPAPKDFLILLAVSVLWGSSFMFIEIALRTFGPFSIAASRIVLAGLVLYLIARFRGERFPTDKPTLKILAAMGLVGTAPFILISWAQQTIDSSTAAIVMAFAPLNILVLAHFFTRDEKLSVGKAAGLVLGLIGVMVLFGGLPVENFSATGVAIGAVFLGTLCYAVATILVRKLVHVSALMTSAGFLVMSSFVVFPLTLIFDPPWQHEITMEGAVAILFLGVFASGFASLLLVHLIKRAGVTFSSMTNYLVPLIAVFWGIFLLGEAIPTTTWAAMALILAGVGIANVAIRKGPRQPRS